MPYRRLPNTVNSRIRSIRMALDTCESNNFPGEVIDIKTKNTAETFLPFFEQTYAEYQQALENQRQASKNYYNHLRLARLYISHFIQVLNLAVIRNEIKKEAKRLYSLEPDNFTVPDLTTEAAILYWGEHIIQGEQQRIAQGGTPIYTPAIAKVSVHFEIFQDTSVRQKVFQKNTNRYLEQLASMRPAADQLILTIWNQVEDHFKNEPEERRRALCEAYGIRYYLRSEEQTQPEKKGEND